MFSINYHLRPKEGLVLDIKTTEMVLQRIIEITKRPWEHIDILYQDIHDDLGISFIDLQASIASLEKSGLVRCCDSLNEKYCVLPEAFGYFKAKKEREQNERKTKWSERRWSLMQILLGFLLGLVSGVLLTIWSNAYLSKDNVTNLPTQEPIKNTVNNKSTQSN